jgi:hypothetical protein
MPDAIAGVIAQRGIRRVLPVFATFIVHGLPPNDPQTEKISRKESVGSPRRFAAQGSTRR